MLQGGSWCWGSAPILAGVSTKQIQHHCQNISLQGAIAKVECAGPPLQLRSPQNPLNNYVLGCLPAGQRDAIFLRCAVLNLQVLGPELTRVKTWVRARWR